MMQIGNQVATAKQRSKKITKNERLLTNPDVKRWYDNLARGSSQTAEVRLRRLGNFCESHQMTVVEVAQLGMKDPRAVMDLIEDHITYMEEQGKAPQYIKGVVTAVKSWLRHFDIQVTRKYRIANVDSTPTLEGERVPEAIEMAEILNRASMRTTVAISLIAKAGLRPQVLGNHTGIDGLSMKDLPDVVIQQGIARCLQSPPRIIVRKTLSKANHQYYTFLTGNATKTLDLLRN